MQEINITLSILLNSLRILINSDFTIWAISTNFILMIRHTWRSCGWKPFILGEGITWKWNRCYSW